MFAIVALSFISGDRFSVSLTPWMSVHQHGHRLGGLSGSVTSAKLAKRAGFWSYRFYLIRPVASVINR